MENKLKKANIMFEDIDRKLESKYKGKIVAIDIESGDYFIGDSELDSYKKAIQKHPNKKFIFKRVGYSSTHLVGILE